MNINDKYNKKRGYIMQSFEEFCKKHKEYILTVVDADVENNRVTCTYKGETKTLTATYFLSLVEHNNIAISNPSKLKQVYEHYYIGQ